MNAKRAADPSTVNCQDCGTQRTYRLCHDGQVQSPNQRIFLSIGFQQGILGRYLIVLFFGGLAATATVCGGYGAGKLAVRVIADGDDPLDFGPFSLPLVTSAALTVAVWFCLAPLVRSRFPGAWLQGTRLTVQEARRRTVDLAAARSVTLQASTERLALPAQVAPPGPPPTVPLLVVDSDRTQVRLRLASRECVLLPPDQLHLLANALSAARCPGVPEVVAWLHAAAAAQRS